MKAKIFVWSAFLLVCAPFYSFGWGMLGHRVVGGIADHYLTTKARTEIKKLLGNESVAMASNWADFIKSDRRYDYLGPWHYINLPSGMSRAQVDAYLKKDTATDVYVKLNMIIRDMKAGKLDRATKVFYLKLLIHLVGDVHQPMHTGRAKDKGGNGIQLTWFNTPTNLHRVWDEQLVEYQQLSYTEHIKAINFATPSEVRTWQRQPLSEWIYESYQIAEKLYAEVKPEEKLSYAYNFRNVDTMNKQLLKAGVRLAGVLNAIFY